MDPDPHADCIYEHTDPDGNGWFLYKYSHRHLTMPNHPGPVPPGLREQLHTPASSVSGQSDKYCHGHPFKGFIAIGYSYIVVSEVAYVQSCPICKPNAVPVPANADPDVRLPNDRPDAKADDPCWCGCNCHSCACCRDLGCTSHK
jgi:hypothetical protein